MSNHNYISDPKNPFFSLEDDVDDETFLNNAPRKPTTNANRYNNYDNTLQQQHQDLLERKRAIEQRTNESAQRSLALLHDSEDIGTSTAEELIRQREQLERTEKRLDDINNTLRFSQKHIQGIKSVFGGLRNYFSGSKSLDQPPPSTVPKIPESTSTSSNLSNTINNSIDRVKDTSDHPSFRLRGLVEENNEPLSMAEILDRNLDDMSGSIARLKGLALGLSEEIETQNDLIDNITDKAEKADITLQRQNKDIRHLLKK